MDRDWEKQLREKMSQYSQGEPDGLWGDIMRQMEKDGYIRAVPEKKGRRAFILPITAIAAAASLAAVVFLRSGNSQDGSISAESRVSAIIADAGEIILPEIPYPDAVALSGKEVPEKAVTVSGLMENTVADNSARGSMPEASADGTGIGESAAEPAAETGKKGQNDSVSPEEDYLQDFPFEEEYKRKRAGSRKKFSTGLSISNLTGSRQNYSGYSTIQPAASSFKGIPSKDVISAIPGNGIMLLNRGNESSTKIRHRQPVRAGITFKYHLSERWGIETGLVYSYLASQLETGNSSMYASRTDQKLHYLGIPLRLSYNIFDSKYLTVYASVGGMAEKCISGTAEVRTEINGTGASSTTDRIRIKPIQWSVSAEAGIQGNITDFLGIYLEPGVSRHFDNGSLVSTVYKEKPLNFNLEFGIRFSFN